VAWLSLDEADNDPQSFRRYFEAALADAFEGKADEFRRADEGSSRLMTLHSLMVDLINICAQDDAQITLILDNFQRITQEQILAEFAFLLGHFPPALRLLLLTRHEPEISLSKLRASAHLREIRMEQLALNFSETSQFLRETLGLNISDEELLFAYQKTEGWVLGLQLIPPTDLIQRLDDGKKGSVHSHQTLSAYLLDEVILPESLEVQEFLFKTSQLERMNEDLCEALFANSHPAGWGNAMLQQALDHHLFIFPIEEQPGWFRYHPLFAEVLQEQLKRRYPTEAKALLVQASQWFESQT